MGPGRHALCGGGGAALQHACRFGGRGRLGGRPRHRTAIDAGRSAAVRCRDRDPHRPPSGHPPRRPLGGRPGGSRYDLRRARPDHRRLLGGRGRADRARSASGGTVGVACVGPPEHRFDPHDLASQAAPRYANGTAHLPRLYTELADWWPLLSAPADYAEEADLYRRAILATARSRPRTLLELGSGGGNNAVHLKAHLDLTLVDLAPGMVRVSRAVNPECTHHVGDMRTVRLGRRFDAVFIHDAIMYMTSEVDLRAALATASAHARPGGVVLVAPDHLRETFRSRVKQGGHDGAGRGLRYQEWSWDPDPDDTVVRTVFAYILRETGRAPRVLEDVHAMGIFPRALWLQALADVGIEARALPFEHSEVDPESCEFFVGVRRDPAASE
ncbi:MAG: methyltransferase domain-containing protein [Candidatus Eisenbacteria bacterium]|nr:methyltransferase domain-containing protein [Candidatus Eisenbacteria bacterium]